MTALFKEKGPVIVLCLASKDPPAHTHTFQCVYHMFELCVYTFVQVIGFSVEIIFAVYNIAGIIIFIVMSSFAGAALRSTKSQVKPQ